MTTHFRNSKTDQLVPSEDSLVLYTDGESSIKPKWLMGRVTKQIIGRDKVVRGLQMKTRNGHLIERPLQLVIPFEI